MNKGTKIFLWIGSGLLFVTAVGFVIKGAIKAADKSAQDEEAKKKEAEVMNAAINSGSVKPTPTPVLNTSTPPPVINTKPAITGKVSEAVLKYPDSDLIGKSVYSVGDGFTAFNTAGKPYTKTRKGQLMGKFAYSKVKLTGGKNIYIKTTDLATPYIFMGDTLLTF